MRTFPQRLKKKKKVIYKYLLLQLVWESTINRTQIMKSARELVFNDWIEAFNQLRIQGLLNETECKSIWKKIIKLINMNGYNLKSVGSYDYEFERIQ